MRIGQYQLRNRLIAAPMAGITDRPFRTLCYEMGAGLTVSEMMSSNPQVWESDKSRLRMVHIDEPGIRTVQIAGSDPKEMADAARINVESGAQIIDINMGCPVKKVCNAWCGSALLQHEQLVGQILDAVVGKGSKALVLMADRNQNVELSLHNLADAHVIRVNYLNMRDLFQYEKVVVPLDALDVIKAIWGREED